MALTDTRLRTLKPAKGKAESLAADGNGLYIRIRVGQEISRTWQFRRKEAGRLSIETLGTYPELSIKEARLKAATLATKRRIHSPTVEEAAEQWLTERVDQALRTAEPIRRYVERAIVPELGSWRVRDVEPADVARIVRAFRDQTAKSAKARADGRPAARALLGVLKGLFGYCVANGWISQSPAAPITHAVIGAPSKARDRVLTDDEIRTVMTTEAMQGPVLRFLLLTGVRIGEAYNGHRDGQHWIVPPSVAKNGRKHRIWLSSLALAQLERHPWAAQKFHVQHWLTANAGGWSAHDLRRTFSTRINAMGVPVYVVEKMLNHTFDGVMAVYNHATYDAERREALDAWSAWLSEFIGQRPADVVPLRQISPQAA
jgi:integrase